MSLNDQDDLMPRPLPKPSQVELISIQPEVPEPSLIIDKFYSQTKPYVPTSFKSSAITSSVPSRNVFPPNDECIQKSADTPALIYSSPSLRNQDLHSRKVSFSSPSNDRNQIPKSYDYCKNSFKPESCSCQCKSHEQDLDFRCDPKQTLVCADIARKMHRIPLDYEYPKQNEMCNCKRCSSAACMNEYLGGMASKEQKQSFISAEELQKTVLKFENLFLKLNYKYSKITENFVSKEELSAVTRSYETKIDSMQAVIDALIAKNKISRCHCSQANSNCKPPEQFKHSVTNKSNSPVHFDECESLRYNCNQNIISESQSPNAFNGTKCEKKRDDSRQPTNESQNGHTKAVESPKCYTRAFENQPRHCHTPSERFLRRNSCSESENRDHISATHPKEAGHLQDHQLLVATENHRKFVESNGHHEQEKEMVVNLKDDQQLKFLYNNIITQVKSMLEKNIPVSSYGKTDPMQLVREATLEQLEKMGLNVKNIVDEDKERIFPRMQSRDEEAKRMSVLKTNVPSSDVSLHMNALAMKYISNYQKDENESAEKKSTMNDVSINCNNVSIATLRYLERHQILSELDKPHLGFGANEIASSAQRFHSIESDHNIDRSFIR